MDHLQEGVEVASPQEGVEECHQGVEEEAVPQEEAAGEVVQRDCRTVEVEEGHWQHPEPAVQPGS